MGADEVLGVGVTLDRLSVHAAVAQLKKPPPPKAVFVDEAEPYGADVAE